MLKYGTGFGTVRATGNLLLETNVVCHSLTLRVPEMVEDIEVSEYRGMS